MSRIEEPSASAGREAEERICTVLGEILSQLNGKLNAGPSNKPGQYQRKIVSMNNGFETN